LMPTNELSQKNGLLALNGLVWYGLVLSVIYLSVMCISYVMIWSWVRKQTCYLKSFGNNTNQLQAREFKMTRTILSLILFHGICSVPYLSYNALFISDVIRKTNINQDIFYVLQILYHSQFCFNFVIYAGTNEQYQKAYSACLHRKCCFNDKNKIKNSEENFTERKNTFSNRMSIFMRQFSGNQSKTFEVNT
jgi:hypothetical protein